MTDTSPVYSPRFELDVGGTTYQEVGGLIGELVVETTVEGADLCTFVFNHYYDPEHHEFHEMDWNAIEPGTDIEVEIGWGGSGSIEPVFVGKSQSVKTEFKPGRGPFVEVTAYGLMHDMMRGVVERSWSEETVVNVADEVLNEYFGKVETSGPGIERNRIVQHGQNDYRFLRGLAEDYGFEFYAERDTAYFTPRDSIGSSSPVATLKYGDTMDAFSAELTESNQVKEVEVRYWDMNAEKEVVGSAKNDSGEGKEVFRVNCDSKEEADAIAESKLTKLSMSRASGYGETDGIPEIVAGKIIRLEDVGDRLTSDYYVTRATHRMGSAGYRTSFEVTELPE